MKIDRQKLNASLAAVSPGLATRGVIEQSECFVFQNGRIFTFDDEVACSVPTSLDIEGAIQAKPLIGMVGRVTDTTLDLQVVGNELQVKGKGKRAGIRMDAEVVLPIDDIQIPEKWRRVPDEFVTGLGLVKECAAGDSDDFCLTCIHITPDYLEACDNYQAARYPMKTGVKKSMLVRKSSLAHITTMSPTKFSETPNWIHFKNNEGMVLSCRRVGDDDYPNLDDHFNFHGQRAQFPPGLTDAVERAEIFSEDNSEANQITIRLRPGRLVLRGEGVTGWYEEMAKVPYDGDPLGFNITPRMLHELAGRNRECEIADDRLRMEGAGYTYVTVLEAL